VILLAIYLTHKFYFPVHVKVHSRAFSGAFLCLTWDVVAVMGAAAVVVNNKGGMGTSSQEGYITLGDVKIKN
jgi:hypothetical protein